MITRLRDLWKNLTRKRTPSPLEAPKRPPDQQCDVGGAFDVDLSDAASSESARARRQAALLRLSAELAASMEEHEICRRVVDGLHGTLDYDVVALFLLDEITGSRVMAASVGYPDPVTTVPPGRGLSERPILDGRLHYSPDVKQEARYFYGMDGSEVDVPIRIAGRVLGVLVAESSQRAAFCQNDFEVLTAAAQQAGLALEKARLLASERKRADELDALRTTLAEITAELELPTLLKAIVERAAGLLDATGGELGLFDEDSQQIRVVVSHNLGKDYVGTRHELGEGAMGRVAQTGEPLIIEDYSRWEGALSQYSHVHATVAAPLKVGDRLVGVFSTVSTDPGRRFTDADLHLLNLFAQQAAIVVENARLYDRAQREIAARKEYEERILRQKEYFEALFVNNPVAVITAGKDGRIVSWNPRAEKLFQYTEEEAVGRNLDDLVANHDSIRAEAARYSERVLSGGAIQSITKRTRKDGSLVDVELHALPVAVAAGDLGWIAIYVDISELQDARRQAEAANQAKSDFLANMSHELRSPLNAILGFAQLMSYDPGLTQEQQENLRIINQSGEHLLTLINDVLEMSKIEAGRVTLQEKSCDLHSLLHSLQEIFTLRAARKGLDLTLERAPNVPQHVRVDEGKLRQVLINLLGNAVKFTQQGKVTLHVTTPDEGVEAADNEVTLHFEVEDTGPGISPEELKGIFEPFVQAMVERQAQEGTGLGLSISRRYVRLMGGELGVTSEVGKGSIFSFSIRSQLEEATEVSAELPARRVVGLEAGQPTFRILVADDSNADRRLLVSLLQSLGPPPQGFEVREASNGQDAIEVWERWRPHLIWMDMRMPIVNGYEAAKRIKSKPEGKNTVIAAITASAFEEDREKMRAHGCDAFVRKPFRRDEIFDTMAQHLGVRFLAEDLSPPPDVQPVESLPKDQDVARLREAIAALPAVLAKGLQEATIRADLEMIEEHIGQIREYDSVLADALHNMSREYDHDSILMLIQPSE